MSRSKLLLAVLLLFAGCAMMSPSLTPQQQERLTGAEALVTRAAAAYGVKRPSVLVRSLPRGAAQYLGGTIYLVPQVLASPDLDVFVAHEFGHHVLGHDGMTTSLSLAISQETAANAEAVRVLVRAGGLTETEAVARVHAVLLRQGEAAGKLPQWALAGMGGHGVPCLEANDLARRFPAVPLPTCR
jgi:hypothetical protein